MTRGEGFGVGCLCVCACKGGAGAAWIYTPCRLAAIRRRSTAPLLRRFVPIAPPLVPPGVQRTRAPELARAMRDGSDWGAGGQGGQGLRLCIVVQRRVRGTSWATGPRRPPVTVPSVSRTRPRRPRTIGARLPPPSPRPLEFSRQSPRATRKRHTSPITGMEGGAAAERRQSCVAELRLRLKASGRRGPATPRSRLSSTRLPHKPALFTTPPSRLDLHPLPTTNTP